MQHNAHTADHQLPKDRRLHVACIPLEGQHAKPLLKLLQQRASGGQGGGGGRRAPPIAVLIKGVQQHDLSALDAKQAEKGGRLGGCSTLVTYV